MVLVVLHWGWRCFGRVEVGGDLSYFAVSGSHPGPEPEGEVGEVFSSCGFLGGDWGVGLSYQRSKN